MSSSHSKQHEPFMPYWQLPYWRLSGFYLFYFAALGALVPFWGLYLKELGFGALAIGQLLAIPMATKVVSPPLWGWLGDHFGQRMRLVRVGSFFTFLTFIPIFFISGYWPLALGMILFSFFWNAVLPQFEVVTLHYLSGQVFRYSRIRVWGSVGFILSVALLGVVVDAHGPAATLPVLLLLFLAGWLASLGIRDAEPKPEASDQGPILRLLREPRILAFFIGCFLMQMGHGLYYAFYSIHMEAAGHSKTLIGILWALGVGAEVLVFLSMHRLLERFGARSLLLLSFVLAALRWLLTGLFPGHLGLMVFAQLLHAATFGVFHAAAIHLVHGLFVGRHQGRGQALYSSLSFGAGGAVGSLGSGWLWESLGAASSFALAGLVSLLAWVVVWRWMDVRLETSF